MTPDAYAPPQKSEMHSSQLEIARVCDEIKELLLLKNSKYGDSALNPVRVFSRSSALEQILVRIDDKISRVQRGAGLLAKDEDVVNDLIGYLVLLKIALRQQSPEPKLDFNTIKDDIICFGGSVNGYAFGDPWDGIDLDNPYDFLDLQATRSPD